MTAKKLTFKLKVMKKILGLDLGTNSIGWALVEQDFENKQGKILGMGSRIIPMDAAQMGNFEAGNSVSQTAERTGFRGHRRLYERCHLRRERLHRVLNVLAFLPEHYAKDVDFEKCFGKFKDDTETKLPWVKNEDGKFDFLFKESFDEMIAEFKESKPELFYTKPNGKETKIPYDWTIYYLRKKALSRKITKEELAWLILNFNQKRGYYQLRGEEEEENPNKLVEFHSLKIVDVVADDQPNSKGDTWYSLHLENGWTYRRSSKLPLFDWKDKVRNFIVTTDLNDDGTVKTDKEGIEKRSFRAPGEDDWTLLKKKTESDIEKSQKSVGTYIYEALLQNPTQKIRGKLVRTIERKFYKEELELILKKQIELQPELFTDEQFNDCVRELYKNNVEHQNDLNGKNFVDLFIKDIIFYQRPLRSQKSNISDCSLEFRIHKDKDGNPVKEYLKGVPKSNPYYQEFRIWQWLYNLKIYRKEDDKDLTALFLDNLEDYENLFDFLNNRKEIEQKPLVTYLLKYKKLKEKAENYRWNFVEDKKYPCNETKTMISTRLAKTENAPANFMTAEIEYKLWHIIYSVTDKIEYEKALGKFAEKHSLDKNSFVDNFKKFPPFKNEYGSFSEKAIKKLLPLMRLGKYWNWENIDEKTKDRISKIITGEYDESIKTRVREKTINLTENEHFQGLQLWLAQYVIYDRHSEADIAGKWKTVADLGQYLADFKQHSLRNPIVEQIITETLRVVRDIWKHYGQSAENFFDEIHIELGREMKNTADDRAKITKQVSENENTNLRIKALLVELQNDAEDVRPYSPIQQEILKIYEDGVINSGITVPDDILKISKMPQPSKSDLVRYKCWLEQKYQSPYTGAFIPLGKLFSSAYEIEHVIPQSRYFDDSINNKVICEAAVNKLKDKQLGLEFIRNNHGQIVDTGFGGTVKVFEEEAYQAFIKEHYAQNNAKRRNLLLDEIPDKMIERQMNDTRHISKFISNLLSNIVRAEKNDDGVNSKNIVPCNGKITTTLKQDWGLNDVWNDLILPRFQRMNELTKTENFTSKNKNGKDIPDIPLELSKGFQKKRIDHRHHAMDALTIAFATRDHVNLLNNQHAKSEKSRYDLQHKLRNVEKWIDKDGKERDKFSEFKKPYKGFTIDAKTELEKIIVSFKQNLRVINKATNRYQKYENGKKVEVEQKGSNWAIRKPLHKETVYAKVDLPFVKVPKGSIITASRKTLDTSFDLKRIETITDTGIQKILKNYFAAKDNDANLAFSPEGIEDLNKNIAQYNDGKAHQPIFKVRTFEVGNKFVLGEKGNKKDKYVEAAKGTNLFFAIYADENGNRNYGTIPLNVVIERLKQGLTAVPEKNEKGHNLLFSLSPNDLVYVPTEEEIAGEMELNKSDIKQERIYKMVSCTGSKCHFVRNDIASLIKQYDDKTKYGELGSENKMENAITGEQIKKVCLKLQIDRLGNIIKIEGAL